MITRQNRGRLCRQRLVVTDNPHPSVCVVCKVKLVKNGFNKAGNQRWKCPSCGASSVRKRPDLSRPFTLLRFLDWLTRKHSQAETDGLTGRSFRHQTRWCWELQPKIPVTGTIHDVIEIDGFNLRTGWCILAARADGKVVAWQWCARESQAAWGALFKRLPGSADGLVESVTCSTVWLPFRLVSIEFISLLKGSFLCPTSIPESSGSVQSHSFVPASR
ncbi:IS1/IS1595 family N-terminal zinc-binding domain-containing protein [Leucobacter japonicus]|uniref:IS1/IS1595 family N-terminal zinc-binding domain-containing protein n=1 Tax=Leucobacter japonicus TaxID=1461259 RepID=UPI003F9CD969